MTSSPCEESKVGDILTETMKTTETIHVQAACPVLFGQVHQLASLWICLENQVDDNGQARLALACENKSQGPVFSFGLVPHQPSAVWI